jgi:hypothetical protein
MRFLLLIALLAAVGCGGSAGPLSGTVTLDGQPIQDGSILLVPDGPSGTATGDAIQAGRYSLAGAQAPAPGRYKVEVRAGKKSGRKVQKAMGRPGELADEVVEAVAERFNSKTELRIEVRPGGGTEDIAVFSR